MQIRQVADVCKDEAVGCVRKGEDWAGEEEMKQQTKSFKNAFSFPLCLFFLFLIEYQHVSKRKNQILTPSKGALISKHLEAPEDHQGSHCPFITQCFSLPLAPPPPPLALPFLLAWSVRARWGSPITLIHTYRLPHSHSTPDSSVYLDVLSHAARSCWNISDGNALRTALSLAAVQNSKVNFLLSLRTRKERL